MLALRLARGARPLVQLRRLLVAAASGGTGFLLLCTLGYAMTHPDASAASVLRLAWCAAPLAATVYFALAVARTDPGTRPRPGLSAIGLGPGRLMAVSAVTTALSTALGSMLALLFFLQLRGDLTGMPFDGAAAEFLAADVSLPLPAALTLLSLVPIAASATVALALRPRGGKPQDATRSYGRTWITARQNATRHATGRGTRQGGRPVRGSASGPADGLEHAGAYGGTDALGDPGARSGTHGSGGSGVHEDAAPYAGGDAHRSPGTDTRGLSGTDRDTAAALEGSDFHWTAEAYAATDAHQDDSCDLRPAALTHRHAAADDRSGVPTPHGTSDASDASDGSDGSGRSNRSRRNPAPEPAHRRLLPPESTPSGLPWGAAALAAGLAVETYASRSGRPAPGLALPGGFVGGPGGVLVGWVLTAVGLALAGPAITYLCGRLLQAVRPGALRLIAGRVLQAESRRIGQPLGVVCAVASGGYATATLYAGARPDFGPLTTLGALLVAGCTLLTLATAAVEAKQARADTTAQLLRLGAPAAMLRGAVALRVGALLVLFGPLTWAVAELAALPLVQ
ncbi:hypothetical protein [Streptomyces sp. NBC_00996]|uniref:hypothetical protein n=1 Tax=Streptomyces sp. NBC_00996 TaxID=2903710 RepID=UPI00386C07B4|nr:hypothetical protein OG390_36790 [Streptomyces sp. NBC_00996]